MLCHVVFYRMWHWWEIRLSIKALPTWTSSTSAFFFEQSSQHTQSHSLQWCCRLKSVNLNSHNQHVFSLSFWLSFSFKESLVFPLTLSVLLLVSTFTSNASSLKFVWGVLLRERVEVELIRRYRLRELLLESAWMVRTLQTGRQRPRTAMLPIQILIPSWHNDHRT